MCKNHDQLHYQPGVRAAAAIIAGPGNEVTRDLLLRRATAEGLLAATRLLGPVLNGMEQARAVSRLEAEVAAVRELARNRIAEHVWAALMPEAGAYDEPPF